MQTGCSQSIGRTSRNFAMLERFHRDPTHRGSVVVGETHIRLTLSAEDFPAKIFPTPDSGRDLTENDQGFFSKPFAWFANYNRESLCWKTWQRCLLGDWIEYLGRWPRSGMMQNGIAYRLPPLVPRISGTEFSFWPTPNVVGYRSDGELRCLQRLVEPSEFVGMTERAAASKRARFWPTPNARDGKGKSGPHWNHETLPDAAGGKLNPAWVEWLMGFPLGWTDLEDSETP